MLDDVLRHWPDILDRVAKIAPMTRQALLDAKPLAMEEEGVLIGIDPEFPDAMQRLSVSRNQRAIQRVLEQVCGTRPVPVRFEWLDAGSSSTWADHGNGSEDPDRRSQADTPQEDAPPAGEEPPAPDRAQPSPHRSKQDWLADPVVRKTLEAFNGDLADVRE